MNNGEAAAKPTETEMERLINQLNESNSNLTNLTDRVLRIGGALAPIEIRDPELSPEGENGGIMGALYSITGKINNNLKTLGETIKGIETII